MEEKELTQNYFISDDGYINIRLKVVTEDKIEREQLVGQLMRMVSKNEIFEVPKNSIVDQLYFHNQNPLTVLKSIKTQIMEDIENVFNNAINR